MKRSPTLVSILVGATILTGCATIKSDLSNMSGAFVVCAKADLGQIVKGTESNLLKYVTDLIALNPATLEADLTSLAAQVGLNAVECAYTAAKTVLAPAPAGSGSAVATIAPPPGFARVDAWLAQAHAILALKQ